MYSVGSGTCRQQVWLDRRRLVRRPPLVAHRGGVTGRAVFPRRARRLADMGTGYCGIQVYAGSGGWKRGGGCVGQMRT
jgi:hypothetical protein